MKQLWQQVRTLKARVQFLRTRLVQGPKKPNPTPADVAAFQTRVNGKIQAARDQIAPLLLKIRVRYRSCSDIGMASHIDRVLCYRVHTLP